MALTAGNHTRVLVLYVLVEILVHALGSILIVMELLLLLHGIYTPLLASSPPHFLCVRQRTRMWVCVGIHGCGGVG